MYIPSTEPYIEGHNTWIANHKDSILIIPVGDLAQHMLAIICFYTQNGFVLYDDIARKPIPGVEKFSNTAVIDVNKTLPLTFIEQYSFISRANSRNFYILLCRSAGVFEGYCPPPHYKDMREATEALAKRKFGQGGVYNPNTPGAWSDSPKVRGSAQPYTEEFKECVALQAQYIYDTYGKFPATIPSIFSLMYVQAQYLDLDFYDHYFKPGTYLTTQRTYEKMALNCGSP